MGPSPVKKTKTTKPKAAKPKAAATASAKEKDAKGDSSSSLTTKAMIMKALEELNEKNGSSVNAIKKYIAENWPEKVESTQFSNLLKKSLNTLFEEKTIIRPKKQEGNPGGASGSYKINKGSKEKASEKEKEKVPEKEKKTTEGKKTSEKEKKTTEGKKTSEK